MNTRLDRIRVAPGLDIPRVVTGLWQVADQERTGPLDVEAASDAVLDYVADGFDAFDMADHYGSAEPIAGRALARGAHAVMMTKWCPQPGPMTAQVVQAGVAERCARLGVAAIDLLQLHWWDFAHLAWFDAALELAELHRRGTIRNIGVTNFDTAHLRVLTGHGIPVLTNQVSLSLLDRRALGEMSAFCAGSGVRLLAYGTLAGGLLSERWLDRPEPAPDETSDWSKSKYRRFVGAIGGWAAFQTVLRACNGIARRRGVSIANVATRWVLEQPAVAAVIVGARLGERQHRADNARLFGWSLDAADRADLDAALAGLQSIPGDCGDEYRRPPYLTASGDLSHHLDASPTYYQATASPADPSRVRIDSGSVWEAVCGYSRAVRVGERVLVCGTTATHGAGLAVCPGDPGGQAVYVLDKIAASLRALGARLEDVVRTRIFVRDIGQWEPVARAHGRVFAAIRPANTLVEGRLVGDYAVEIEAEAIVTR